MKKSIILLMAIALFSCNSQEGYKIKIQMEELANASVALKQYVDGEMVTLDSVELDSTGTGELAGVIEAPEMMYLGESGNRQSLPIFMDNFNYSVYGTFEDVSIDVDAGPQADFNLYKERAKPFEEEKSRVLEVYYQAREAGVEQDSLQVILQPYYEASEKQAAYDSVYMADNPSSPVTLYLLRSGFHGMSDTELEVALEGFGPELHGTSYYAFLSDYLEKMKSVKVGNKYIDFELPDTSGNMVSLSEFVGEGVLLIDFWASWCGPCRRANPGVVEIYKDFNDRGFDIVGVSLDRNKEKWMEAIEEDNLTWNHMSDLEYWNSRAADLYAVKSIPHTVLLDKNGIIIARNLSEDELREKLEELL